MGRDVSCCPPCISIYRPILFYYSPIRPSRHYLSRYALDERRKKAFKTEGKGLSLWFYGTMAFTVYNLFIFWGQNALGTSGTLLASIMESLMPMISVLILWLLQGQRPNIYTISCILIAFIGVLFSHYKRRSFKLIIDEKSASSYPGPISISDWLGRLHNGRRPFRRLVCPSLFGFELLYGTATATVIVLMTTAVGWIEPPTISAIRSVQWELAFMIIFPGLIALLGWNVGISILKPVNGLLFINFVPVTTVIITFIQGHALTVYDLIGISLVVLALLLNNVFQRRNMEKQLKNQKIRSQLRSAS